MKIILILPLALLLSFTISTDFDLELPATPDISSPPPLQNKGFDFEEIADKVQEESNFVEKGTNTNSNIEVMKKLKEKLTKNLYNGPGFLGGSKPNLRSKTNLPRFVESDSHSNIDPNPLDMYFNENIEKTDRTVPSSDNSFIRNSGLSNGLLLSNNKRTLNVETTRYMAYYNDLD